MSETDEFTRRLWLFRLGSGAMLAGFGGPDMDAAAPPLPPGLYLPSVDHLAHVLKPAPAGGSVPAPVFFSAAEYQQMQALVAAMLGEQPGTPPVPEVTAWIDLLVYDSAAVREAARSLSPAHRTLAVAFYGESAVREMETLDAQQICRGGLSRLPVDRPPTLAALESLESGGDPFIVWLKRRVIEGFYTSQAGLKELDYKGNSFYDVSPGCDHGS